VVSHCPRMRFKFDLKGYWDLVSVNLSRNSFCRLSSIIFRLCTSLKLHFFLFHKYVSCSPLPMGLSTAIKTPGVWFPPSLFGPPPFFSGLPKSVTSSRIYYMTPPKMPGALFISLNTASIRLSGDSCCNCLSLLLHVGSSRAEVLPVSCCCWRFPSMNSVWYADLTFFN
jgi:hypothetical protein